MTNEQIERLEKLVRDHAAVEEKRETELKVIAQLCAQNPEMVIWRKIAEAPKDGRTLLLYAPPTQEFDLQIVLGWWDQGNFTGEWKTENREDECYNTVYPTHFAYPLKGPQVAPATPTLEKHSK